MKRITGIILLAAVFASNAAMAQTIKEYTIKRANNPITIDGKLDEAEWAAAAFTDAFVVYTDGSTPQHLTHAKLLWDDTYLYAAYVAEDNNIFATLDERDKSIWTEECVEIFIDPDDDTLNYVEWDINPIGTIADLWLDKEWSKRGKGHFEWNLEGEKAAVTIDGTVNDPSDTDTKWIAEIAIPFAGIAFSAPTMNFPPKAGDTWRVNLYRHNRSIAGEDPESTAWNQTDQREFHAPDLFGKVIFSSDMVLGATEVDEQGIAPREFGIRGNYPNPFNPATTLEIALPAAERVDIEIYNVLGQQVKTLASRMYSEGTHEVTWNGTNNRGEEVTTGLYFACMTASDRVSTHSMLLLK